MRFSVLLNVAHCSARA